MECSQHKNGIELNTTGRRFSFVSEIGFQLYSSTKTKSIELNDFTFKSELYNSVERFCIQKFNLFNDDDPTISDPLTEIEFEDAFRIAATIESKFYSQDVYVSPKFKGCSIIDTCYGDILVDDILYEIKSVNRNFNIIDFRQLLTYCALNYVSKEYDINSIGLFNPKKGMSYTVPLNVFSSTIAGAEINELYWDFINFISQDKSSK